MAVNWDDVSEGNDEDDDAWMRVDELVARASEALFRLLREAALAMEAFCFFSHLLYMFRRSSDGHVVLGGSGAVKEPPLSTTQKLPHLYMTWPGHCLGVLSLETQAQSRHH